MAPPGASISQASQGCCEQGVGEGMQVLSVQDPDQLTLMRGRIRGWKKRGGKIYSSYTLFESLSLSLSLGI